MKTVFNIAALTIATTVFYTYVGHMVPQKETYPPEGVEIRSDMSSEELARAGEEIVGGKGTCLSCHTIGADQPGRFPDLGGIGAIAAIREEGLSDVEYLARSLYEPNAYIVEGFNPGMFPANQSPVNLSDPEIMAVIAYLQSLGATPTVTMATKIKYAVHTVTMAPSKRTEQMPGAADEERKMLLVTYGCVTCHSIDTPVPMVGPTLFDVGAKLTVGQLYEAIMDPDATVAEGSMPGIMVATLTALKFYDKVSAHELKAIVDYLASRTGSG